MKKNDLVRQLTDHYKAKLAEEKERFGVLGISGVFIENNGHKVACEDDGAGLIWKELSKQSGLHLFVDEASDPQVVFAILSREPVPYPHQLYELYELIVDSLEGSEAPEAAILDADSYCGPYRFEFDFDDVEDYDANWGVR